MSDDALRSELVRACRWLAERGLIAGFDGNLSVRTGRGTLLVTPAGVHKGLLERHQVIEVDATSGAVIGQGRATSELGMHLAVLSRRADAAAVVHSHAPTAVAMTLLRGVPLNGILPELAIALGEVKTVPYARPGTDALAARVADALATSNAIVIERHGTVSVGSSITEALARTEMVEHAARIIFTANTLQAPSPIDLEEFAALLPRRLP